MAAFSNAAFGEDTAFDSNAFDLGTPLVINDSFSDAAFGKDTAFDSDAFSFGVGTTINISFSSLAFFKNGSFDEFAWSFDDLVSPTPDADVVVEGSGGTGGWYEFPEREHRKEPLPVIDWDDEEIVALIIAIHEGKKL